MRLEIAIILVILVTLWVFLRRDFVKGLAFAVFFWVSMTTWLRIQPPGNFPALTIHRLMLMVVVVAWSLRGGWRRVRSIPLRGCFAFWFLANLVSMFCTEITFATSFKDFLDFVLEIYLFYLVASTSIQSEPDAMRLLRAAWLGLILVAVIAVIQRHTGFNPVSFIPGSEHDSAGIRVIQSTYPHRILFGAAMSMGVPLTFALRAAWAADGKKFRSFWGVVGLFCLASYYGFSRGPWIGLALAIIVMVLMCSPKLRKELALIGVLGVVALVASPGVIRTLSHFINDTVDTSSFKGGTAEYRLELWRVAFHEVCQSPKRFLFGVGPSAGSEIQIEWVLSYRNELYLIDSWDNEFAYILYQSGFVGLLATLLLYFRGLQLIFSEWRNSWLWPARRDVLCCLVATAAILVWMMTNVYIFAKQLDYLYWTVVAAGVVIARSRPALQTESADQLNPEDWNPDLHPVGQSAPTLAGNLEPRPFGSFSFTSRELHANLESFPEER